MAKEEKEDTSSEGSGGGKKKLIIIISIVIILAIGGGVASFFILGGGKEKTEDELTENVEEIKPAIYISIEPQFVITFDVDGRSRFMQTSLSVVTRDQEIADAINQHMPLIKNNLVMILGGQEFSKLKTSEGKNKMREEARQSIDSILEKELGKPGVEEVLLTNFVMQ